MAVDGDLGITIGTDHWVKNIGHLTETIPRPISPKAILRNPQYHRKLLMRLTAMLRLGHPHISKQLLSQLGIWVFGQESPGWFCSIFWVATGIYLFLGLGPSKLINFAAFPSI